MNIEVRIFASLTKYRPEMAGGNPLVLDMPEGSTVKDVLDHLGIPLKEVKVMMINGRQAELSSSLQTGDRVGVFPPVAGG